MNTEFSIIIIIIIIFSACSAPSSVTVDASLLQWSLNCETIPLVCPVGRDGQGCSVLLDPTEVTAAISRALQPHKVMFLNNSGGLRSQERKAREMARPALKYCIVCIGRFLSQTDCKCSVRKAAVQSE